VVRDLVGAVAATNGPLSQPAILLLCLGRDLVGAVAAAHSPLFPAWLLGGAFRGVDRPVAFAGGFAGGLEGSRRVVALLRRIASCRCLDGWLSVAAVCAEGLVRNCRGSGVETLWSLVSLPYDCGGSCCWL
jgi:hypothetical protein